MREIEVALDRLENALCSAKIPDEAKLYLKREIELFSIRIVGVLFPNPLVDRPDIFAWLESQNQN